MTRHDLIIEIDPPDAMGEALFAAVTVFAPDPAAIPASPITWFAWPGGGHNRRYFDLQMPGGEGYS
jgi:hypothetical protein